MQEKGKKQFSVLLHADISFGRGLVSYRDDTVGLNIRFPSLHRFSYSHLPQGLVFNVWHERHENLQSARVELNVLLISNGHFSAMQAQRLIG